MLEADVSVISVPVIVIEKARRKSRNRRRIHEDAVNSDCAREDRSAIRDPPTLQFVFDLYGRIVNNECRKTLFRQTRIDIGRAPCEINALLEPAGDILPKEKQHAN